jgi:hypothetical protein
MSNLCDDITSPSHTHVMFDKTNFFFHSMVIDEFPFVYLRSLEKFFSSSFDVCYYYRSTTSHFWSYMNERRITSRYMTCNRNEFKAILFFFNDYLKRNEDLLFKKQYTKWYRISEWWWMLLRRVWIANNLFIFRLLSQCQILRKDIKENGMHEFCFAVCLRRIELKKKGSSMSILDINL